MCECVGVWVGVWVCVCVCSHGTVIHGAFCNAGRCGQGVEILAWIRVWASVWVVDRWVGALCKDKRVLLVKLPILGVFTEERCSRHKSRGGHCC
jgi:hypothetical protein